MAGETRAIFSIMGPNLDPQELVVTPTSVRIGRSAENDVILTHPQVGRQHLRLQIVGEKIYAIDLGGNNGTLLNGKPLEFHVPVALSADDRLQIGPYTLTLREIVVPESKAKKRDAIDTDHYRRRGTRTPNAPAAEVEEAEKFADDVETASEAEYQDIVEETDLSFGRSEHEWADADDFLSDDEMPGDSGAVPPDDWAEHQPEEATADPIGHSQEEQPPPQADDTDIFTPVQPPQEQPLPAPSPATQPPPLLEPEPRAENRTLTGGSVHRVKDILEEAQQVQFSAYYPREIRPDEWQPLQAYMFKAFAADNVTEDAEKQIGQLDRFRQILEDARQHIPQGELITAQPHLPGFQFNPPIAVVGFYEDWHRFEFKLRATDAPLNHATNGFLTFTTSGIIVADIPLSIFVTDDAQPSLPHPSDPQPMYDTIFASYSHRDMQIVERVEAAAKALGMTYLRDVITLRSGQHWGEELLRMIDDATIFQLFWSETAAESTYCRQEWEYALRLNRDNQYFIRPVYWTQPMPAPPVDLQHLHFAYQPDLVK